MEEPAITFERFATLYLAAIRNRLRSYKQIRSRMQRHLALYGDKPLTEIDRQDISSYIDQRLDQGIKPCTINVEISTISAAYKFAQANWGWQIINPVTGQHMKTGDGRLRWLSQREKDQLQKAIQKTRARICLPEIVKLAINTGCRKNELLRLQWKDIDLQAGLIVIQPQNSKTGRRRIIPINKNAREALETQLNHVERYCPESPWVFAKRNGERLKYIDGQFIRCVRRAGIEDFRFHDLRHTFASDLVMRDVPIYHVKELLGHQTMKMTERYAHLATSALTRAVAVLDETEGKP